MMSPDRFSTATVTAGLIADAGDGLRRLLREGELADDAAIVKRTRMWRWSAAPSVAVRV